MTNILPTNYDGLKYLSWLNSDHNNVQNLCNQIFKGGVDSDDPNTLALINAAVDALSEVQNDITKLQSFIPPVNKKNGII